MIFGKADDKSMHIVNICQITFDRITTHGMTTS